MTRRSQPPRAWAPILVLVLLASALGVGAWAGAAWADPPSIDPMVFLPGDSAIGPAAGSQLEPAVARGGGQYLVAWTDDRGGSPDIYAARVDANGAPIDLTPIALTQAVGTQNSPRVAWNGTNWLVAWQGQIPTQYYYSYGVLAVRVSPQGQVLDASPIVAIAYQNSSSLLFGLASDGTNWAVVAEGTSAGEAAILGVRIAPDGTVLDPGGVLIVPETYYLRFGIEVGGVPGEYLLAWNEWRSGTQDDILGYRLTTTLARIDASPLVIASRTLYETNAKIASNGTDFFVAWNVNDNYLSSEVYGGRVTFGGQILDPNGRAFTSGGIAYGRNPAVAWDGANWIASWPNYGTPGLNVGRMSTAGVILDPGGTSMPALGWGAIAGAAAGGFVALWSDTSGGSADVFGAPVSGGLVPGIRTCVSLGAPRQTEPSIAYNGSGYLAVFLSARSEGSRVLGQRLDANGVALDLSPFEIAGPAADYRSPRIAWNGSVYLVTWVLQSRVYGRRVDADGTLLDPAPISIMNGQEGDVAALDDLFLVVGNYAPQNPQYVFVFGTRVRGTDGTILDPNPVTVGGSFSLHPRVARVGNQWLAVWEQHPTHDDPHASVVAGIVTEAGSAGTPFSVSAGGLYNLAPAVAAGTDTALVAWSDAREGFNNLDIYGRRVLAGGAVLDGSGLPLSVAPNSQTRAALGWSGREFLALFQDPRNIPYFFDEHLDVYGARCTSGGQVLDPQGFPLANDPVVSETQPATAGGDGAALLGCAVYRTGAPIAAFRVGTRLLHEPGNTVGLPEGGGARPVGLFLTVSPNPSRGPVALHLTTTAAGTGDLSLFDLRGRKIRTLLHGNLDAGRSQVGWDGKDAGGRPVPAGVYFARLRQARDMVEAKLVLR